MFGLDIKLIIVLAVISVIASVGLGVKSWLDDLTSTIAIQEGRIATQKLALASQQGTIAASKDALKEWKESERERTNILNELMNTAIEADEEKRRLNELFSEHNMGELALQNPEAIKRRVNRGTAAAFRMLECASGPRYSNCTPGNNPTEPDSSSPSP